MILKLKHLLWGALAAVGISTAQAEELKDIQRHNWVQTVYEGRSNGVKLRNMTFPGTHDSGTWNITDSSDLHSSAPSIFGAAVGIVANWAKTVSDNCYDQMNAGIRYLDLRVREHEGDLILLHTLVGARFEDCLSQVQLFMDENPKEIVFLEATHTPGGEFNNRMLDLFDQYFGNRKPANNKPVSQLTLDELWAADSSDGQPNTVVIMINGVQPTAFKRGFFNNNNLKGGFANTTSTSTMINHLNGLLSDNFDINKMLYTTYTLTPQTKDIVADVLNVFSSGSLEDWSDKRLRPAIGDHMVTVEAQYTPSNFIATDFHEYTSAVASAIRLNTQVPPVPQGKLQIAQTSGVDLIWTNRGSGGKHDGSIWRPRAQNGFYPLSDTPRNNYSANGLVGFLVKGDQPGVVRPLGYHWVWDDRGSGADQDVSIWRPIPPKGYVCLGDVAVARHGFEPSTDLIRCVHQDYVTQAQSRVWMWNDEGTGSDFDVSLHDSFSNGSTVNSGHMRAYRGYGEGAANLYQLLREDRVTYYEKIESPWCLNTNIVC